MTEEEMIEREFVMVDRWCAVVVRCLEDNVFSEHAIGVDYLRKGWHAAGRAGFGYLPAEQSRHTVSVAPSSVHVLLR